MATFTFPYWAKPVLDFYNLKWPDIDEDAVAELGHHVQQLANDAWLFAVAVKGGLGELADASTSEALAAFHEDWGDFTGGPLEDITDAIGQGAVATTLAIANGITIYKGGILGILTVNIGSDIALISTGVGAAAVIAKKAVMREVLELALDEAARQAASWLVGQWNDAVDSLVLGPLENLASDIGRDLGGSVRRIATMSVPTHAIAAPGAALYIDHHDIIDAVGRIKHALDRLVRSAEALTTWSKGSGYTAPTPVPDPTVRIAIKDAFDWAADAFVGEIKQIGEDILNQVIDIITDTYDKYVEADTQLGQLARQLREKFAIPVASQPYVIDRSTRPRPIMIVDAPPPVITGAAVSDARANITIFDLPDRPEPVVTGPGESDARFSIRSIVLPDWPDPVVTGPGESDARSNIGAQDRSPGVGHDV